MQTPIKRFLTSWENRKYWKLSMIMSPWIKILVFKPFFQEQQIVFGKIYTLSNMLQEKTHSPNRILVFLPDVERWINWIFS